MGMDIKDKITYYTNLIKDLVKEGLESELFWAYLERGMCYFDLHEYDLALSDFNQASSIKPEEAVVYYNIALTYLKKNNSYVALEYLKKVIEIDSNNSSAYYEIGNILYDDGRYTAAAENYTMAIRSGKRGADVYYRRAMANYRISAIEKALSDINTAIKIKPSVADYYVLRANINLSAKRYREVIYDLDHLVSIKPSHSIYRFNRAIVYATVGSLLKLYTRKVLPLSAVSYVGKIVADFQNDFIYYYDIAENDINLAIENEKAIFGDRYISPSFYLTRGAIYLSRSKYTASYMDFAVAKDILKTYYSHSSTPDYRSMRVIVEMYLDNYSQAEKYLCNDDTTKSNILMACWLWRTERDFEDTFFWFKKAVDNGFDVFEVIDDIFEGYFLSEFIVELDRRNMLEEFLKR